MNTIKRTALKLTTLGAIGLVALPVAASTQLGTTPCSADTQAQNELSHVVVDSFDKALSTIGSNLEDLETTAPEGGQSQFGIIRGLLDNFRSITNLDAQNNCES